MGPELKNLTPREKQQLGLPRGTSIKVKHYLPGPSRKIMRAETLNNAFMNDAGDVEVGIRFENGDKGYAVYSPTTNQWEVGEGDYLGENKTNLTRLKQLIREEVKKILKESLKVGEEYNGDDLDEKGYETIGNIRGREWVVINIEDAKESYLVTDLGNDNYKVIKKLSKRKI